MRYDQRISFERDGVAAYDPKTGNYEPGAPTTISRYASVMDTRVEMLHLIYGELRQGTLTVQLQSHHDEPFDRIRIGDRSYKPDYERRLRHKHVFIVSEVQGG